MEEVESLRSLTIDGNQSLWAHLPSDLLCDIFSRIFAGDRAVFCSVCKPWNAVSSLMTNQRFPINSDSFLPLLMHSRDEVFHPIYGGVSHIDFLYLPGCIVRATRDDWLLMIESDDLHFFNPFTKQHVKLPHLERPIYYSLYFSSTPTSADCLVVAAVTDMQSISIYYRRCGDPTWTTREILLDDVRDSFEFSCCSPVVCGGLFYFLGIDGELLIYNPKKDNVYFRKAFKYISELIASGGQKYMLESDGKVMAIFVSEDGRSLYIFQWNVSKKTWETVESLGNRMLFISRPLSFCQESTITGTANKIYFPRFVDNNILFYSLSTKKYHTFALGTTYLDFYKSKGVPKYATWIKKQSPAILPLTNQPDHKLYPGMMSGRRDFQTQQFLLEKMGERIEELKVKEQQQLIISRPPLLHQPYTWLMIFDGDNGEQQAFYSVAENHYYFRNVLELQNKNVRVCYEGWLVLEDKCTKECSLLNISTMEKLQLPSALSFHHRHSCYVLSSPKRDGDCRIIVFDTANRKYRSCHLGDKEFIERNVTFDDYSYIGKVINFEGKLYGLAYPELSLAMAEISDPCLHFTQVVSGESILDICFAGLECKHYLVEACGEILLISLLRLDDEVSDMTIFKADFRNGEWEILDTIGDVCIFLDLCFPNAYSSPASALGLKGNAVYWESRRKLYRYDMEDESVTIMSSTCPVVKRDSPSCWVSIPYN